MENMSIQPLWLTHFIEILLVLEFQLIKFIVGVFSYKAHFRPQISSNVPSIVGYSFVVTHNPRGRTINYNLKEGNEEGLK